MRTALDVLDLNHAPDREDTTGTDKDDRMTERVAMVTTRQASHQSIVVEATFNENVFTQNYYTLFFILFLFNG